MIAVSMSVAETDGQSMYNYLVWSCCQLGVWNAAQPALTSQPPPTPPSLIGPFPRHEGRAALKALITETTPVLICPYLSAFVVAAPGRGLSHTKPTECLSVCLLLCPPCGATYLNVDPNYLAVTTFLKHAYANKIRVLHMILYKSSTSMSWVYFCFVRFPASNIMSIYKTFNGSSTFQHRC